MIKFSYLLIACTLMYSCNSDSTDKNAYIANATNLLPWINEGSIKEVKMEKHPYVFFVDSTHEFSYGFKAKLKYLKTKNANKINVSCQGFLYQIPSQVKLVVDIKNNGQNIFWQSQSFDLHLKEVAKWGNVSLSADIPNEVNDLSEILVYVWSPSHEVALFDNLTVKFE